MGVNLRGAAPFSELAPLRPLTEADLKKAAAADALTETRQLSQLSVCDLKLGLKRGDAPLVIDVRTPGEWKETHIDGARHLPMPALTKRVGEAPKDKPVAVICGSGYRSTIAASLLLRSGHTRVANVMGGMGAYSETTCADMAPDAAQQDAVTRLVKVAEGNREPAGHAGDELLERKRDARARFA